MNNMNGYDSDSMAQGNPMVQQNEISLTFANIYKWMTVGLGLTALVAWYISTNGAMTSYLLENSMILWGLIIAELGLVFFLSARVQTMSYGAALGLFLFYAALNGVTLSLVFLTYTTASIVQTFLITTGMYAAMALFGYTTKRDLSGWGSFLFMGVIGIIAASLINFWLQSPMIQWVTTYGGVLIFAGLTAYDHQKLKSWAAQGVPNLVILGALTLYLDFINLFYFLLQIFGSSED